MLELFRDGYGGDVFAMVLVTVMIGSFVVLGLASVSHAYFTDVARAFLGDPGDYDLVVHVRSPNEAPEEKARELRALMSPAIPGVRVEKGPVLMGNSTFFVSIPRDLLSASAIKEARGAASQISGYNGSTLVLHPRVPVRTATSEVASLLAERFEGDPDVEFVLLEGTALELVLTSSSGYDRVRRSVEESLSTYTVVELVSHTDAGSENSEVLEELAHELERASYGVVHRPTGDPEVPHDDPEGLLRHAVERVVRLAHEIEELRGPLIEQLERVESSLSARPGDGAVQNAVVALVELVTRVRVGLGEMERGLAGTIDSVPGELRGEDPVLPQWLEDRIVRLEESLDRVGSSAEARVAGLSSDLELLEGALRVLSPVDADHGDVIVRLIELLEGEDLAELLHGVEGETLGSVTEERSARQSMVVQGRIAEAELHEILSRVGEAGSYSALARPAGFVSPDVVTAVDSLLGDVRRFLMIASAIAVVVFSLLVDHTQFVSCERGMARRRDLGSRARTSTLLYLCTVGVAEVVTLLLITGAVRSWPGIGASAIGGILIGTIAWAVAERFSPVRLGEVAVGEAMGLSYAAIVREIVLPDGRPGAATMLNRVLRGFRMGREVSVSAACGVSG